MSRKKRTKTKKKKSAAKKQANAENIESVEKEQADLNEEEAVEKEAASSLDEDDDADELEEEDAKDDEASKTSQLFMQAQSHFENGNYRAAQQDLIKVLDGSPSPEEAEQAQDILSRMEIDVRTLMVGAIGMLTILLIPTVGFLKALWTLPILFLILLLDPKLFRSPEQAE